ncbi:MAG: N-acetylmuramoyl-L-alanine amidase [Alphaproteobacteria bacterium]|nr:N-acetylmuramoyl-L-alanine amidase [Alphaproteobacteria bacterium]
MRARAIMAIGLGATVLAALGGLARAAPADPLDAIARDVAAYRATPSERPVHAPIKTSAPVGAVLMPIGLRLGGDDTGTRVVLDLAAPPASRPVITPQVGHLFISAPGAAPESVLEGAGHGLVSHWRIRAVAGGALVDLSVAPGVGVMRRFLLPPSGEASAWRYVIDLDRPADERAQLAAALARSGAAGARGADASVQTGVSLAANSGAVATTSGLRGGVAPAPALKPGAPPVGLSKASNVERLATPMRPQVQPAIYYGKPRVIVIDPGHGGHDTGAESLLRNEKDINLAAALDLKRRLERSGRYKIVLTRSTDVFIPLAERVQIARRAKADLFISLHSDSAGADPTPHGASIYTLSDRGTSRVHQVMHGQDLFAGAADLKTAPTVSQILLDLTQRNTRNRSAVFAGMLLDHLSGAVDLLPHGQRDANYFVLLAPDVPAVLLEMGFITNPADEMRLTDPDERAAMMDRVGDAVDEYFAPRAEVASR